MSFSTNNYHQELVKAISNAQRLWIEWQHISTGLLHCPVCLKLDRCWFAGDNKHTLPQHPHCHCVVKRISYYSVKQQASASAPFSKFERRDNGAPASYITGWMVHPNGEIRLITPYGGK